jgi:hypothetical protein
MVWRNCRLFRNPQFDGPHVAVHALIGPRLLLLLLVACTAVATCRAQSDLPDAPAPSPALLATAVTADGSWIPIADATLPDPAAAQQTFPPFPNRHARINMPGLQPNYLPQPHECITESCSQTAPRRSCCVETSNAFAQYLQQNAIHIYTPRELGRLAVRGVIDPFNLLTIVGTSAYTVATDAHSPYGPGAFGIAKVSGVALTQDMTNAFFETFLIPSIDHQDPHYHRMPNAPMKWRIAHCIYQPFWTDSDTGKGMVNYSTVVGDVLDEAVDSSYVPYTRTGWGPSADRIAVNLATTPIGNFVSEFVPDVARHINLNVVFVQRIVNRVAVEEGGPF